MTFSIWLTKAIHENDLENINSFPKVLMDNDEKRVVDYLNEYNDKYGSMPPIKTIRKEVLNGDLLVNDFVDSEQLTKLFSETKRQNYERTVREITRGEETKDTPDFQEMANRINYLSGFLKANDVVGIDSDELYEVPTGRFKFKYNSLDVAVNTLLDGEVCLFVGPPKSRKTWISLDLAIDAYANQDKKVYFTSLELGKKQIQQRVNAMIGAFNPKVFRIGSKIDLNNAQTLYKQNKELIDAKTNGEFIIPSRFTSTVWDVVKDVKEYKPDVVFVDSIYMFTNDNGRPIMDDWGALGNMIGILKNLAREMKIQIIVNSQLKRDVGEEPDSDDVAYSFAFVQTCDLIVGLVPFDEGNKERTKMNIIASRNSGNLLGNYIEFDWDFCRIQEYVPSLVKKMVT